MSTAAQFVEMYATLGATTPDQFAAAVAQLSANIAADEANIATLQSQVAALPTAPVAVAKGGTGQTTQQAAINALAGAVTLARFLRGDGANVSMAAIAPGDLPAASGLLLRAPVVYAPATAASFSTTASDLVAVSSANINTGAFTAPASGSVIVTANVDATASAASTVYMFGLCAHGTTSPVVGNTITLTNAVGSHYSYQDLVFVVTGLTPGSSYNYDLMFASSALFGGTVYVVAAGNTVTTTLTPEAGPAVMRVQAI